MANVIASTADIGQKSFADYPEFQKLSVVALLAKSQILTMEQLRQTFVLCNGDLSNWVVPDLGWKPVTKAESDQIEALIQVKPDLSAYFGEKLSFSTSSTAIAWAKKLSAALQTRVG